MALRPKIEECVGVALSASTRTTSSSLIPLFLLHLFFCCSSNTTISLNRGPAVQRMCKTKTLFADLQAIWMKGGGWWWLVGGRSYLILEPVWWKPQCAAAALLSFHCCSVARGLGRGAPRRTRSQQQEVKSRCRAFQVITANGYCR